MLDGWFYYKGLAFIIIYLSIERYTYSWELCIYGYGSTWFYNGTVKGQQLFPLCRQDIPSIMIPWDFFVPFKVGIPVEEIIAGLEDCAFDETVQRAYTQERNNLRSEKERP